jgi:hypothetical protein
MKEEQKETPAIAEETTHFDANKELNKYATGIDPYATEESKGTNTVYKKPSDSDEALNVYGECP